MGSTLIGFRIDKSIIGLAISGAAPRNKLKTRSPFIQTGGGYCLAILLS